MRRAEQARGLLTDFTFPGMGISREGIPKKMFFQENFLNSRPHLKQQTPTHPPRGFGKTKSDQKFHEQIICLEWSNMPYKHDIVLFTKKFRTLDPHPPTVLEIFLQKKVFFGCFPIGKNVYFWAIWSSLFFFFGCQKQYLAFMTENIATGETSLASLLFTFFWLF